MQITILSVEVETVKTARGGYKKASVAYKDEAGKVAGKTVMSFVNEKVFDFLTTCKAGEVLNVTSEKDANNYWQWIEVTKAEEGVTVTAATNNTVPAKTTTPAPRNTYETPEERAQKQIYIVRQSSITNAIALLESNGGKKNTKEEAVEIAKFFEAYVFDKDYDDGSIKAMKGDEDLAIQ